MHEIDIKIVDATPIEPGKTYALQVSSGYSQQQLNEVLKAFRDKTGANAIIMSGIEIVNNKNG